MPEPRLRGEARNEAIRRELQPLAPGERPAILTIASVVFGALGLVNAVGAVLGIAAERPQLIAQAALALVLAAGLWQVQLWAALGALAAATITGVAAFLWLLLVADTVLAVLIAVGVLALSGTLFWRLIRPLGRMQAPRPE